MRHKIWQVKSRNYLL